MGVELERVDGRAWIVAVSVGVGVRVIVVVLLLVSLMRAAETVDARRA